MGGLGNQLFQIFTTIAYAADNQIPFYFSGEYNLTVGTKRHTYWNTFLKVFKEIDVIKTPVISNPRKDNLAALNTSIQEAFALKGFNKKNGNNQIMVLREKEFAYNSLSFLNEILVKEPVVKEIRLHGYFQTAKYFGHQKEHIFKMVKLFDSKKEVIERNPSYKYLTNSVTISLHFRLGDYKFLQDLHPILPKEYYLAALLYVMKSLSSNLNNNSNTFVKVLYFCEEADFPKVLKTIDYLKQHFPTEAVVFEKVNTNLDDWEQMVLMSLCSHNIIANSSFSWWSAYFNTNYNKIICCPKKWFGPRSNHDTKDLYLDEWIQI
jgi:hypothetical protein